MKEAGNLRKARRMLMDILTADLRCLGIHGHLGSFAFHRDFESRVSLHGFVIGAWVLSVTKLKKEFN
jgi:hypothetical protein